MYGLGFYVMDLAFNLVASNQKLRITHALSSNENISLLNLTLLLSLLESP